MILSLKELEEVYGLMGLLEDLKRIEIYCIDIFDAAGDPSGKLVRDNGVWSFEYGEDGEN